MGCLAVARVVKPLGSLSASGSISGVVTFNPVGRREKLIINRQTAAGMREEIVPAQVVSGQAVARFKPQRRNDLKRGAVNSNSTNRNQIAQNQNDFRIATILSAWLVRNNIAVSELDPTETVDPIYPWWDGLYLHRAENLEFLQFPTQEQGRTMTVRRKVTGTTTKQGHIMRQLITAGYTRLAITENYWNVQPERFKARWFPHGTAPFSELPEFITLRTGERLGRDFMNLWMQIAFRIPRFELERSWIVPQQFAELWVSPWRRSTDDPVVVAWENFLSSENDYVERPVTPFAPRRRTSDDT